MTILEENFTLSNGVEIPKTWPWHLVYQRQ